MALKKKVISDSEDAYKRQTSQTCGVPASLTQKDK